MPVDQPGALTSLISNHREYGYFGFAAFARALRSLVCVDFGMLPVLLNNISREISTNSLVAKENPTYICYK